MAKTARTTILLEPKEKRYLERIAFERRMTLSEILRQGLVLYLANGDSHREPSKTVGA